MFFYNNYLLSLVLAQQHQTEYSVMELNFLYSMIQSKNKML